MDLAVLADAVAALDRTATIAAHPLADEAFLSALVRLIPADEISLNDLRLDDCVDDTFTLIRCPGVLDEPFEHFWDYFWGSAPCSYPVTDPALCRTPMATSDFYGDLEWRSKPMYVDVLHPAGVECELVVPLPGPESLSRRLLLARTERRPFTSDECEAARVLRPHLIEALRRYERERAVGPLTSRQREVVSLLTAGLDNATIARRLRVSTGTVRIHLENVFARLDVRSRSEAVAKAHPDLVWR